MATVLVRPEIFDRLKETRGIRTDEAMANLGKVSLSTYLRYRDRKSAPNVEFLANMGAALGLSLGELASIEPDTTAQGEQAA